MPPAGLSVIMLIRNSEINLTVSRTVALFECTFNCRSIYLDGSSQPKKWLTFTAMALTLRVEQ
jgi:hypothetical protein